MSRVTDALLTGAYAANANVAVVDIQYGGQNGYSPVMSQWVSNAQYVRRNVICLLLESPKIFDYMTDSTYWVSALRSLFEQQAIRITGLTSTLEADFAETNVGGAGQMQEDLTDVKESRSQVSFTWNEKYGKPVARFLRGWITYGGMDPETKLALINTISGVEVTDMLPDMTTASAIFIEPDPTGTKVQQAWLGVNMFPRSSGENTAQRDMTAGQDKVDYDIQFTGIYKWGAGVDALAQTLLSAISLTGANPNTQTAFITSVSSDVSAASNTGYAQAVSTLASDQVSS